MLERMRQGWEQNKLRAWLQKEMPANPQWKVLITPDLWLCPICLEAGAQFRKADDLFEAAAIHLSQMCEKFKDGLREPALPLDKLVATARYLCAEERVQTDPAWQQRSRTGVWYCPYCVRDTPARMPANGAPDRAFLEAVARHFVSCPGYQNGHGTPKAAQDVRTAARRADLQTETLEVVKKKLGNNEVWQVRSSRGRWVCPYCRHIIGSIEYKDSILLPEATVMQVTNHLVNECEPYRNRENEAGSAKQLQEIASSEELFGDPGSTGGPMLDAAPAKAAGAAAAAMDPKQRLLWMKDQIVQSKAWQQRTSGGIWYCPYCVRETDVQFPLDGRINMAVVERIFGHVDHCFAYDHGRGSPKPLEAVAAVVRDAEAVVKAAAQVRQKMAESPVWRVKDPEGAWVCPYCRKLMKNINISTEVQLQKGAPPLIAKHLIEHCSAYKNKTQPASRIQELESVFKKPEPAVTVPKHATPTPMPEELMRSINEEIASARGKKDLSAEMKQSLEEAKKRQLQMLPDAPVIPGLDFGVVFRACSHVAGDFYDFPRIGPDELGILMGDVSGHGIEAGMVMALVKKVISIHGKGRSSPRETLVISNPEIYPDIDRRTFITGIYCIFHEKTKKLKVARAGHNPLILFNAARTPPVQSFEPKGMALGMDKGPRFEANLEELEIQMQDGDMVFLYTDGLAEATNPAGEEFGTQRILDLVQKFGKYDVDYLLHKVDSDLTKFRGEKEMDDDLTMIGFKIP